jgi:hypothetical protein
VTLLLGHPPIAASLFFAARPLRSIFKLSIAFHLVNIQKRIGNSWKLQHHWIISERENTMGFPSFSLWFRTWMDLFTFQERVPEVDFSSLKEIPIPLQARPSGEKKVTYGDQPSTFRRT